VTQYAYDDADRLTSVTDANNHDTDFAIRGEEGPEALIEAVEAALNRKQLRRIK